MKKQFMVFLIVALTSVVSAQKNMTTAIQYYKRGVSLVQKKNYSEAIVVFDKSIKENPKLGIAYYHRGLAKIKNNAQSNANPFSDICSDFEKAKFYGVKVSSKLRKSTHCL